MESCTLGRPLILMLERCVSHSQAASWLLCATLQLQNTLQTASDPTQQTVVLFCTRLPCLLLHLQLVSMNLMKAELCFARAAMSHLNRQHGREVQKVTSNLAKEIACQDMTSRHVILLCVHVTNQLQPLPVYLVLVLTMT